MTQVAGVDSSTQSCKVVVRDADTGALVRHGSARHPEGTEVDPAHWEHALQSAVAAADGLDDVDAVAIGGQQHGARVHGGERVVVGCVDTGFAHHHHARHAADRSVQAMSRRCGGNGRDLGSLMQLLDHLDHYALQTQRALTIPLVRAMLENE